MCHIVEYLTCVTDPQHIIEVIDVLLSLCERASKSKMAKRLSGMGRGGGGDFVEVTINTVTLPLQAGCAKTYVRLSETSRNLVRTCNSLTWLVGDY